LKGAVNTAPFLFWFFKSLRREVVSNQTDSRQLMKQKEWLKALF